MLEVMGQLDQAHPPVLLTPPHAAATRTHDAGP